jgi:TonB family protein
MAGVTPLWLEDLPAGRHNVEVRMAGYAPLDTVVSLTSDRERLYLLLKPSADLAGLRSNEVTALPNTPSETPTDTASDPTPQAAAETPAQAAAETPVPEAPAREDEPEEDPEDESPRAAADPPAQEDEDIQNEDIQNEDIEAQISEELRQRAGGILSVTSEPAGASILIDGSRVGETPAMVRNIREGDRDVTLQLNGYEPATVSVRVRTGETSRIHRELISNAGTLLVLVKPWGSIYVDGALHVENTDLQYRTRLPEGTHGVRAVHPVLGAHEEVVNVTAQSPVELVFDLNQGARSIESEAAPEGGGESDKASVSDVGGVYIVAEVAPQLIGGLDALQRQVAYPEAAARARIQGRVYMRLVVDENGEVSDLVVTRGLCPECDREALRVARLARFRPAEVGGEPVPAWYNLYLNFRPTD